MNRLIPLLALASLAACSPGPEAEPADAPAEAATAAAPTELGGVDLTQPIMAMGAEPFWSVDIVDGVATFRDIGSYTPDEGGDVAPAKTGPAVPTATADGVAYAITLADGTALTLTLTAGPCPDLGEQTRALNATLAWSGSTMTGCADRQSAYDAPEAAG
ncbi:hypothetical protein [Brevundimonas bacteroides]|uniref:hypothetical protein n=1 Tax=Brevundimonas bacteroides TaxID=74311 RepID=UPI00049551CE|nr:hypothetical protein [Brevundimonas bacteroides]